MPNYGGESSGPSDLGGGNYEGRSRSDYESQYGLGRGGQGKPPGYNQQRLENAHNQANILTGMWEGLKRAGGWVVDTVTALGSAIGTGLPRAAEVVTGKIVDIGVNAINEPFEMVDTVLGLEGDQSTENIIRNNIRETTWRVVSSIGTNIVSLFTGSSYDASMQHKINTGSYTPVYRSPFRSQPDWERRDKLGYSVDWPWEKMSGPKDIKKPKPSPSGTHKPSPGRSYHSTRFYGRRARLESNTKPVVFK